MRMPNFTKLAALAVLLAGAAPALAQNTPTEVPPVLDVHFHALLESPPPSGTLDSITA